MTQWAKALAIALVFALMIGVFIRQNTSAAPLGDTQFQVSVNSSAHQAYGLYYPVTYMFSIPAGSNNLEAQYRYNLSDSWTVLDQKTAADFFNGVNAARFDYANDKAYLSVAFTQGSDLLFLRVVDNNGVEVPLSYLGIPTYYDDRKAAVTISLDDWASYSDSDFNDAATILSARHIHFTVGVITQGQPDISLIQHWVESGWMEVASHSRTHPCTDNDYLASGYDNEAANSKLDLLTSLTLTHPYVPTFIEPCGFETPALRQAIVDAGYLVTRGWGISIPQNTFSAWGSDDSYETAFYTVDTWSAPWYTQDDMLLAQVNASFDAAYAEGGIYHLVDHPWQGRWFPGSTLDSHAQYISDRLDVWYAAFGELYLYHYVQERGQVTVSPIEAPTRTPAPPTATPTETPAPPTATATNTPIPPTATPTNTPIPPTATPTETPVPPTATATNTPIPPTATPTETPVPPTATPTNTPIPPTATPANTPVPPTATATNTPIPPTATPTETPVPPTATATNTPIPPTATPTNTPIPPTATSTNTPIPPTATPTETPVPPTATNTPIPPTATPTETPVPPTATNTPIPPTATPTETSVPPTATATNTPIPPTATATNTPIPPTATSTNTPIPPTSTETPVPPTATATISLTETIYIPFIVYSGNPDSPRLGVEFTSGEEEYVTGCASIPLFATEARTLLNCGR